MASIFKNQPSTKRSTPTFRQERYLRTRKNSLEKRAPNVQHEYQLQKQCCRYLQLQYPTLIFRSDTGSGRWEYNKRDLHNKVALHSDKDFPDITIFEPRTVRHADGSERHYCGLLVELKKDGTPVILKVGPRKGMLSTDEHIQAQAAMLKRLLAKGYYGNFAVGFDEFQRLIDWYMGKPQNGQLF